LEKEDSIKGYSTNNLKKINDSILTFYGNFGPTFYYLPDLYIYVLNNYYIMNKNTKIIFPIVPIYNFLYDNVMLNWYDYYGDFPPESNKIDFINQDSIYSIFTLDNREIFYDSVVGCGIVNYSISGDTNFVYKLLNNNSGIETITFIGIKATNDGGAIINLYFNNHPCFAKFMPNGLASILDIATKEKETIRVYPNPAKDYVDVDIECTNFKASDIELIDMQGKLVKKAKLKAKQGNRIDVSSLSAGAYTYNVSLNGKTISGKIIIGK
jgi:hypothetical protein